MNCETFYDKFEILGYSQRKSKFYEFLWFYDVYSQVTLSEPATVTRSVKIYRSSIQCPIFRWVTVTRWSNRYSICSLLLDWEHFSSSKWPNSFWKLIFWIPEIILHIFTAAFKKWPIHSHFTDIQTFVLQFWRIRSKTWQIKIYCLKQNFERKTILKTTSPHFWPNFQNLADLEAFWVTRSGNAWI